MSEPFLIVKPCYGNEARAHSRCVSQLRDLRRAPIVEPPRGDMSNVSHARSVLANFALREPDTKHLWLDADIRFPAEEILRMVDECSEEKPIISGVYAAKEPGSMQLSVSWLPDSGEIEFFDKGRVVEVQETGFGATVVHRTVYEAMQRELLPKKLGPHDGMYHYFPSGSDELDHPGEDQAFCRLARKLGFTIWADTRIRLFHIGTYEYGVEDAYTQVNRNSGLKLNIK